MNITRQAINPNIEVEAPTESLSGAHKAVNKFPPSLN